MFDCYTYKKQNHPWSTPWSTSQSRTHWGSRHSRAGAGQGGAWLWGTEEAHGPAQRGVWWSGRASRNGLYPGWALRGKEEVDLRQSRWTLQAARVFRDVGRVQGCITGGRDGVRVDMHMALIPRSVMGGHVGLSAESITDGTQRLASGCPSPKPGGEEELPTSSEPVGNRRREKDDTIQCLKCTFGAGIQH